MGVARSVAFSVGESPRPEGGLKDQRAFPILKPGSWHCPAKCALGGIGDQRYARRTPKIAQTLDHLWSRKCIEQADWFFHDPLLHAFLGAARIRHAGIAG